MLNWFSSLLSKRKDDPKRIRIVQEILESEIKYHGYLAHLCSLFSSLLNCENLSQDDHNTLHAANASLEAIERLSNQLSTDLSGQTDVGKIFSAFAPFLKMYAGFCSNHHRLALTLAKMRRTNAQIRKQLEACEAAPAACSLQVQSLLIMPVQRVPRHRLLLQELLKHTPPSHADHDACASALLVVQDAATQINRYIKEAEQAAMVLSVQSRLLGGPELFSVGVHRRLVREGNLAKFPSSASSFSPSSRNTTFFLFSETIASKILL